MEKFTVELDRVWGEVSKCLHSENYTLLSAVETL